MLEINKYFYCNFILSIIALEYSQTCFTNNRHVIVKYFFRINLYTLHPLQKTSEPSIENTSSLNFVLQI